MLSTNSVGSHTSQAGVEPGFAEVADDGEFNEGSKHEQQTREQIDFNGLGKLKMECNWTIFT